jgi:hypothetical protein
MDSLLGSIDPSVHMVEDLFQGKVGFVVLLNFPLTTLPERLVDGEKWTRAQWAQARLTQRFSRRVPADVQQKITEAVVAGERYVASYNLFMHHLLDEKGRRLWPKGSAAHQPLEPARRNPCRLCRCRRAQQAAHDRSGHGAHRRAEHSPRGDRQPSRGLESVTNQVTLAPVEEVEADAPAGRPLQADKLGEREPDRRYELLLSQAATQRLADPYSPSAKTLIERSFQFSREIPEEAVVRMLAEVCGSPLIKEVAKLAEQQLGRKLQPHDLWFAGFRPRGKFSEGELDALTRKRYPTAQAFESALPSILQKLDFAPDKAKFLGRAHPRRCVTRGRSCDAGHATG